MKLKENVPLAPLTTLGVGGVARFFVAAHTVEDVIDALQYAQEHAVPVFVLGGGSNVVVADTGFEGLVIKMEIRGIRVEEQGDQAIITAGAGEAWDDLVVFTVVRGYRGFECLSGIPGTVGGGVVANLGAYGAQCSDTFIHAKVLVRDGATFVAQDVMPEACEFSYHDSIFGRVPGRHIVLQATFSLPMTGTSRLSYKDNRFDLTALAEKLEREPSSQDVREEVLRMREEKGVLASCYKSAGSFFHMPFVSAEKYVKIMAHTRALDSEKEEHLRPWAWKQPDGTYKIAPGFLLEYTKFKKGYIQGGAGVSPKHTLSIINVNNARASEIVALAKEMHDAVEELFDIDLEREVEYVGAFKNF